MGEDSQNNTSNTPAPKFSTRYCIGYFREQIVAIIFERKTSMNFTCLSQSLQKQVENTSQYFRGPTDELHAEMSAKLSWVSYSNTLSITGVLMKTVRRSKRTYPATNVFVLLNMPCKRKKSNMLLY